MCCQAAGKLKPSQAHRRRLVVSPFARVPSLTAIRAAKGQPPTGRGRLARRKRRAMLASDDDKEDLARIDELRRKAAAPVPTVTPDGSFGTDEEVPIVGTYGAQSLRRRDSFRKYFIP